MRDMRDRSKTVWRHWHLAMSAVLVTTTIIGGIRIVRASVVDWLLISDAFAESLLVGSVLLSMNVRRKTFLPVAVALLAVAGEVVAIWASVDVTLRLEDLLFVIGLGYVAKRSLSPGPEVGASRSSKNRVLSQVDNELARGAFRSAKRRIAALVAKDPTSLKVTWRSGRLALMTGECESASDTLNTTLGRWRGSVPLSLVFDSATADYCAGFYQRAIPKFGRCAENGYLRPQCDANIAASQFCLGDFDGAVESLSRVSQSKVDFDVRYLEGLVQEGLGRPDEAARCYEQSLQECGFRCQPATRLAAIFFRRGERQQSVELLKRCIDYAGRSTPEADAALHFLLGGKAEEDPPWLLAPAVEWQVSDRREWASF